MKTSIIVLLAGSACFAGADVLSEISNVTSTNNTVSVSTNTSTSTVLALTLNKDAFIAISGENFDGKDDALKIYDVSGTWEDGSAGVLGVSNNGSSSSPRNTGLYANWTWGSTNKNTVGINMNPLFTAGQTDWNNVQSISLVLAFSEGATGQATNFSDYGSMQYCHALTLLFKDGSTQTLAAEKNDLYKFTIKDGDTPIGLANSFTTTGVTVNSALVDSFTLYSDKMTFDQVKELSVSRLIPEPTTATLSLLALAGLAARRRRK